MGSVRESVLSALHRQLHALVPAPVLRNAVLPERVPPEGLVILRDGEPGDPDGTLNPRSEYYSHRAELELFMRQEIAGTGEAALDALIGQVGTALRSSPSLDGYAENLTLAAPQTSVLAIDGATPVLTALIIAVVEYLVTEIEQPVVWKLSLRVLTRSGPPC